MQIMHFLLFVLLVVSMIMVLYLVSKTDLSGAIFTKVVVVVYLIITLITALGLLYDVLTNTSTESYQHLDSTEYPGNSSSSIRTKNKNGLCSINQGKENCS